MNGVRGADAVTVGAGRSMLHLADAMAGRDNNVQLLRFAAAIAVLLFHCFALTEHWTDEPLWRLAHELNLGALGVQVFFVLSGFLVTQSYVQRKAPAAFLAARALRIYPALVAATVVTLLLAAWSSPLPAGAFWGDPRTIEYMLNTPLGVDVRHYLPGAFAANPRPGAVNGSLYTLPYELRLYAAVLLAGVAGLLARRPLAAVIAVAVALALLYPAWPNIAFAAGTNEHVGALVLPFALGALAYAWRDALPLSLAGLFVTIALVAADPGGLARGALFAPLLTYAVLVLAYHPALRWSAFNRAGDYSYGLYVYAFPIQQALIERLPGIDPWPLFGWALPATLAVAILSWHGLEAPVLGLKSSFTPTTVPR